MDNYPAANRNGFDIYPLVYRMQQPRAWHQPRLDRTYGASVMICRQGEKPNEVNGRVFRVPDEQWTDLSVARSAALRRAEDIIAGLIPGASLAGI